MSHKHVTEVSPKLEAGKNELEDIHFIRGTLLVSIGQNHSWSAKDLYPHTYCQVQVTPGPKLSDESVTMPRRAFAESQQAVA